MIENLSLKNHFLIAMPNLGDPNFFRSVTYICEHNEKGAMGIVISHPMSLTISDLLEHMDIIPHDETLSKKPVLGGGPVQQERGFVIHSPFGEWQSTEHSSDEIWITTSRDILEAIANQQGPEQMVVALGYAAWQPGQLEQEIADNAWISSPAESSIVFDTPYEDRWRSAANLVGVDVDHLSGDVGHA